MSQRILLLLPSLSLGGTNRQVTALARQLKTQGHRVRVCTFFPGGDLESLLREDGIRVSALRRQWGTAGALAMLWRLFRLLRYLNPDVLYSFLPAANVAAATVGRLARPRMRLIWTLQLDASHPEKNPVRPVLSLAERQLHFLASAVAVPTQETLTFCRALKWPERKLNLIPPGIDARAFRPRPRRRGPMRAAWELRESDFVIGRVARLDPVKGYETLLRAAAEMPKTTRRRRIRYVCVGHCDLDQLDRLQALARELDVEDRIIWAGHAEDIETAYAAFDLVVSTSRAEGFPYSVAEAMACGVPCVASDVGDTRWVVAETGRVVPPADTKAVRAALREFIGLSDKARTEKGKAARRRIENLFSVGALTERYLALAKGKNLSEKEEEA